MLTIGQACEQVQGTLLTPNANTSREITNGLVCDLLSWVMAQGKAGCAWVTVQTHMNVIAVATLLDMACVIVPEGIEVDTASVEKAEEEGIAVISSALSAYEIAFRLHEKGVVSA